MIRKKTPIREWQVEERPREKLWQHGTNSLTDAELIAVLLSSGSKDRSAVELARDILTQVGNQINKLSRLGVEELCHLPGIGPAKAITLLAALELGKRRESEKVNLSEAISSSTVAFQLMKSVLEDKSYEEFWIVLLNRANRFERRLKISEGGVSGTVADPKKIFKYAIAHQASGIILFHNHPSGSLKPSEADKRLTQKIYDGCKQLDILLIDHLIVSNTGYFSFADEGLI
jgi:DNA repair protein RadC